MSNGRVLQCYVDAETLARLEHYRANLDSYGRNVRTVEDLAEAAISEAALQATLNFEPARRSA